MSENIAERGPDAQRVARGVRRHLHHHWRAYCVQGGLMIAVGVLALFAPFAATLATVLLFGWLLIAGGGLGAVALFRAREASGFWANLLLSVLAVVLGVVMILNPVAGSVTLVWALAIYFVLSGVFNIQIARAVKTATGRFWLLLVSGVIDIALAAFLVLGLPGTAVWAVGLFLGVSLITSGVALASSALDARNNPPRERAAGSAGDEPDGGVSP